MLFRDQSLLNNLMDEQYSSQFKVMCQENRMLRPSPLRLLISQHPPSPRLPDSEGVSFVRQIPSEVLLNVFSFVPLEHQDGGRRTNSLMLVCRHWSHLFETIVFRDICFSKCGSDLRRRVVRFLTLLEKSPRLCTYVRYVRLRLRHSTDDPTSLNTFAKILTYCQGIRRLHLRHSSSQGSLRIVEAIRKLPQLEDLNLSGLYTGLYIQLALSYATLPNLKKLYLQRLGPRATVGSTTDFRRSGLPTSMSPQEYEECFPADQLHASNLTSLSLDKPSISPSVMSYIYQIPNRLTSITITRLGQIHSHEESQFSKVQQLLNLHSQSLQQITLGTATASRGGTIYEQFVPVVVTYPCLEKITLSAQQVLETPAAHVHECLQAPRLHTLIISCSLETIGRRRDARFSEDHIPWFKAFAAIKQSDYSHSKLSKVCIDYIPRNADPEKHDGEMPASWPWTNIRKARDEVLSLGDTGLVLLVASQSRPCTETAWDKAVRLAIMKRDREEFKSEDDLLAKFRRRREPNNPVDTELELYTQEILERVGEDL